MQSNTTRNEATLKAYTSTMTDWLHMKPLKPMSIPATNPEIMQIAFSHLPPMALSSSIPSTSKLLPRETSRPSKPAASAPPTASPSATRQATFLIGNKVQKYV